MDYNSCQKYYKKIRYSYFGYNSFKDAENMIAYFSNL